MSRPTTHSNGTDQINDIEFLQDYLIYLVASYNSFVQLSPSDYSFEKSNSPTPEQERCARIADRLAFDGVLFRAPFVTTQLEAEANVQE